MASAAIPTLAFVYNYISGNSSIYFLRRDMLIRSTGCTDMIGQVRFVSILAPLYISFRTI